MMTLTYRIDEAEATGHRSITCLLCGMQSWNAHDVAQRYCGHCHHFHLDSQGLKENLPRDSKK